MRTGYSNKDKMQAYDEGNIFYSDQRGPDRREEADSPLVLRIHYREFIRTFRVDEVHVYRCPACFLPHESYTWRAMSFCFQLINQFGSTQASLLATRARNLLRQAISLHQPVLEVDIDHLMEYNDQLTNELLLRPGQHIPIFEKVISRK